MSPGTVAASEVERGPIQLAIRFALIAAQLLFVVLVIRTFRIEESFGFVSLAPLIFGGFVVHAWLPRGLRLPFFVLLGMAAPVVVLGGKYGLALVAAGLGMIALCHLPIAFRARVGLVALAGVALAAVRAGWLPAGGSVAAVIVPVLAAMFMFRIVIYLYDLRHDEDPVSIWERLGYFFLLPNVCFLLFPVVDYKAFRRTHYEKDAFDIYQKGVLWMMRGILHILLYRIVYFHLLPAPQEIDGLGGLVQHVVFTYALYLRVSGQFHLIIGILCLFGFNLPETHHLYFLASSFTNYWRRINIYWKDFMTKVFYYPVVMRFRRLGPTVSMVLSTVVVFLCTWLLHSYQWFWLNGSFPLRATDGMFWGTLCAVVVVNSLYEVRTFRTRAARRAAGDARSALAHSASVVGMFIGISLLWSLWSAPSVGIWLEAMSRAGSSGPREWALLGAAVAVSIAAGVGLSRASSRGWKLDVVGSDPPFMKSAAYAGVTAVTLFVLGTPIVQDRLGSRATELVTSIQGEYLNSADLATLQTGYYQGILAAPSYTSALWRIRRDQPDDWTMPFQRSGVARPVDDLLEYELIPSTEAEFRGARIVTNEWGMHDRPGYALAKPAGTYRVALLGASYTMGVGVPVTATFQTLVEDRLNREAHVGSFERFEVLNFAVAGYSIVQSALAAERKAAAFQPDAMIYVVSPLEMTLLGLHIVDALERRGSLGIDPLDDILARAGVLAGMSPEEVTAMLRPFAADLMRWGFAELARVSREAGGVAAVVYLPATGFDEEMAAPIARMAQSFLAIAAEQGLLTMSLEGVFNGLDEHRIRIAPWDRHPNEVGHRVIAERFHQELLERAEGLGIVRSSVSSARPFSN